MKKCFNSLFRRVPLVSCFVLLMFLALFVAGLILGEAQGVFEKGVAICLSCIGIG